MHPGFGHYSMDNVADYGPEIPGIRLTATKAIERNLIANFDLYIGVITDHITRETIYKVKKGRQVNFYTDRWTDDPANKESWVTHTDVAQALWFLLSMKPGEAALTFHSNKAKAGRMQLLLQRLADDLGLKARIMSVDSHSRKRVRTGAIALLKNETLRGQKVVDDDTIRIVCNCRLFTEGVDTPALNVVCFFDPKHTTIGIVQSIGRALRLKKDGSRARVLLPIFAPDAHDAEDWTKRSRYGNMQTIGLALRDADVVLEEPVYEISDAVAPITTKAPKRRVGVYIHLPTAYDHLRMKASLDSVVLHGDPNLKLDLARTQRLLLDIVEAQGSFRFRGGTSDEDFVAENIVRIQAAADEANGYRARDISAYPDVVTLDQLKHEAVA